MSRTRLQTPLEAGIGAAAALTVIATTLNSGSLASFQRPADPLRWVFLSLLCAFAVAYVVVERPVLRVAPVVAAAVVLFETLALASAWWSIAPHRTLGQAAAFGVLLAVCGVVAATTNDRPRVARNAMLGVVVGAGVIAVGGFVLLLVDHAVATYVADNPDQQHFRGLGANANTVSLLGAVTLAPALWLAACRSGVTRLAAGVTAAALGATIAASGSRGALVAAVVGIVTTTVLLDARARVRVALALLAAALAIAGVLAGTARTVHDVQQREAAFLVAARQPQLPWPPPKPPPGWPGALGKQIGSGSRADVFSSGRIDAWRGAVEQGWNRGVAGFGFGNENPAFIDRYADFQGVYVENSFLGTFLQLGLAGVVLLTVALAWAAATLVRVRCIPSLERRNLAAAAGGAGLAAVATGVVQSDLVAAGNVAALPGWLGLLVAASVQGVPVAGLEFRRLRGLAAAAAVALVAVGLAGRVQADRDTHAQRTGILDVARAAGPLDNARLSGFSLSTLYDCFFYRANGIPWALQTCYDHSGTLVDAIDRRRGGARFWSLRYEPAASSVRRDPRTIRRVLGRIGALAYAERYLQGYPPYGLSDSAPVVISSWLRLLGRTPPRAGRGSA